MTIYEKLAWLINMKRRSKLEMKKLEMKKQNEAQNEAQSEA